MPLVAPGFLGEYNAEANLPNAASINSFTLAWTRTEKSFWWVRNAAWEKVSFGQITGGSDTGAHGASLSSPTGVAATDTATAVDSFHLPFNWTTTKLAVGSNTAPGAGGTTITWKIGATTIGSVALASGTAWNSSVSISDTAQAVGGKVDIFVTDNTGGAVGLKAWLIGNIDVNA